MFCLASFAFLNTFFHFFFLLLIPFCFGSHNCSFNNVDWHSINTSVDMSWLIVSQELTNFLSFHMNRSTLSWLSTNYWSGDWVSTEYWSGCLSSTEPDVDKGSLSRVSCHHESVRVSSHLDFADSWSQSLLPFIDNLTIQSYAFFLSFFKM